MAIDWRFGTAWQFSTEDGLPELSAAGFDTGAPGVGGDYAASGYVDSEYVNGVVTIGQTHVLTATGVTTGAVDLDVVDIGQRHTLVAVSIATGAPVVGTPSPTQAHILAAVSLVTGAASIAVPDFGQIHPFTAVGFDTGVPVIGVPTLEPEAALGSSWRFGTAWRFGGAEQPASDGQLFTDGIATGAAETGTPTAADDATRRLWEVTRAAIGTDGYITYADPAVAIPVGSLILLSSFATSSATAFTMADLLPQDAPLVYTSVGLQAWLDADDTRTATVTTAAYVDGEWIVSETLTFQTQQIDALTAAGFDTAAARTGTPNLTQTNNLVAVSVVAGAPVMGTPTFGQTHILTGTGFSTGVPVIGTPNIAADVQLDAAGLVTGAPVVGRPTMTQAQLLAAIGITTGAPIFSIPGLGPHRLTAQSLIAGLPIFSRPFVDFVPEVDPGRVKRADITFNQCWTKEVWNSPVAMEIEA